MTETYVDRYPVDEAIAIISDRLADGWSLLGVEGLWVDGKFVRPDLAHIFDGSPDGLRDAVEAATLLSSWPRNERFCVELLMTR